ncbi:uncharacterized protein K02A2.6-like [Acropora millepora]|uniref:uncharacterized protein K02A2.6-like n=1 Tax=Acropora millepora TaxID=45264 RepID=UPI001CF3350A|nr:uncharacterized protein K02A2.6-like [Acropora millepora]
MPTTLQQRVIDLAHEGHQGIVKTKKLLREKVWFHRMNNMVEKKTTSCGACQIATPRTTREPLQMSPLPASPWREVSVDFKQLSSCEYLLVITDDYSRYPVVELVRSTSASTVIPQLDKTFSTFGIPEIVRSDNGPPFNGREFREFAQTLGFKHMKSHPVMAKSEWSRGAFHEDNQEICCSSESRRETMEDRTLPTAKKLSVDTTQLNRNRPCHGSVQSPDAEQASRSATTNQQLNRHRAG